MVENDSTSLKADEMVDCRLAARVIRVGRKPPITV